MTEIEKRRSNPGRRPTQSRKRRLRAIRRALGRIGYELCPTVPLFSECHSCGRFLGTSCLLILPTLRAPKQTERSEQL